MGMSEFDSSIANFQNHTIFFHLSEFWKHARS
jgi:hypothetical protein